MAAGNRFWPVLASNAGYSNDEHNNDGWRYDG
jgi:hypothetical protein